MNTDKLCEIVGRIIEVEGEQRTQKCLSRLETQLSQLMNNPQNPDFQSEMSEALKQFADSMTNFKDAFSPQDYDRLLELSERGFSPSIVEEIKQSIRDNAMSPKVVYDLVQNFFTERDQVFSKIAEMHDALKYFKFDHVEVEGGHTEVGFLIPRGLFDDNLDGLVEELRDIRNMIHFFSEVALGEHEPARVSSISTTDPLFFFSMAAPIAKYLAISVTWALGVWYSVEKIRNLRAQTAQIEIYTSKDLKEFFDDRITAVIDAEVESKVKEIIKDGNAPENREGELTGQLTWALKALLAKTERGMTIELRLPPPPIDEGKETDEGADEDATHQELVDIQKQLVFPIASENPVLELPEFKDSADKEKK